METPPFICMNLCHSLFFKKIDKLPETILENGDFIQCYRINPSQSRNIEPDPAKFIENLHFTGQKDDIESKGEKVELPKGQYIFSQYRAENVLKKDEWLEMVIEQQKDGLWERKELNDLFFLRFLYEDGAFVTQIFRT